MVVIFPNQILHVYVIIRQTSLAAPTKVNIRLNYDAL